MNIVVMGPQGSGKSTQAELLAKKLDVPHIETGEIYRRLAGENSPLGKRVKKLLDEGKLIDDETTFEVVDKHLSEIRGGFVLDGFPRTLVQAQRKLFPVDKVFYLMLADEEATKRLLLRRRLDDTEELIRERLRQYHEQTEPILDYYRSRNILIEVDGGPAIEVVHQSILDHLPPYDNP